MQYVSTRGAQPGKTFSDILFEGYAPDNGLYVPESYPQVSRQDLSLMRSLSFDGVLFHILSLFWPEAPREALWAVCREAADPSKFSHGRGPEDVGPTEDPAPIQSLNAGVAPFNPANAPTLAFDDCGMSLLALLFKKRIPGCPKEITLVGATSGDMGASCEAAFAGVAGAKIAMLAPKGRLTSFQDAQLYSCAAPNVLNIEVDGSFDNCQDLVELMLKDADFKRANQLGAINTVLWARVAVQIACYFYAYSRVAEHAGDEVVFTVPCGNFGNAFAGWVAKQMGLPILRLIVATNENDAMDRFMRTGVYEPAPDGRTVATSSPSSDISRAANFERFLFEGLGRDGARTAALIAELHQKGRIELTKDEFARLRRSRITSGASAHVNRLEIIERAHVADGVLIDPHTADCLYAGIYLHPVGVPTICFETSAPAKAPDLIYEATRQRVPTPAGYEDLFERPKKKTPAPADLAAVKAIVAGFAKSGAAA